MPRVGARKTRNPDPREKLSKFIKALLEDPDGLCIGGSEMCCSGCSGGGSELVEILAAFVSQNDAARQLFASLGGLEAISILIGRALGESGSDTSWRTADLAVDDSTFDPTLKNEVQAMGALVLLQCFCASPVGENLLIAQKPTLAHMVSQLAQADDEDLDGARHAALQVLTGWHSPLGQDHTQQDVRTGGVAHWLADQALLGIVPGALQLAEGALMSPMLPIRKSAAQLFTAAVTALPLLKTEASQILGRMSQNVLTSINDRAIPGNHHSTAPDFVPSRAMLRARHISEEREKLLALGFLQVAGDLAQSSSGTAIEVLAQSGAARAAIACYCSAWGLPHHSKVLIPPKIPGVDSKSGLDSNPFRFRASAKDASAPHCPSLLQDFQSREQALDAVVLFVQNGAAFQLFACGAELPGGVEVSAVKQLSRILLASLFQDTPGHIRAVTTIIGRLRVLKGPPGMQPTPNSNPAEEGDRAPGGCTSSEEGCKVWEAYEELFNISCYLFDLAWASDFKGSVENGMQSVPSLLRLDSSDAASLEVSSRRLLAKQGTRLCVESGNQEEDTPDAEVGRVLVMGGTESSKYEAEGAVDVGVVAGEASSSGRAEEASHSLVLQELATCEAPSSADMDRSGGTQAPSPSSDKSDSNARAASATTTEQVVRDIEDGLGKMDLSSTSSVSAEKPWASSGSRTTSCDLPPATQEGQLLLPHPGVGATGTIGLVNPMGRSPIDWPSPSPAEERAGAKVDSGPVFALPPETKPVSFGILEPANSGSPVMLPCPPEACGQDDVNKEAVIVNVNLAASGIVSAAESMDDVTGSLARLKIDVGLGYRVILQVLLAWKHILESECSPVVAALDCSCWWQRACLASTHDRPQVATMAEHVASLGHYTESFEGLFLSADASNSLPGNPTPAQSDVQNPVPPDGPSVRPSLQDACHVVQAHGEEAGVPPMGPISWSLGSYDLVEGVVSIDAEMQEFLRQMVLDEDTTEDAGGSGGTWGLYHDEQTCAVENDAVLQQLLGLNLGEEAPGMQGTEAAAAQAPSDSVHLGVAEDESGMFSATNFMMSLSSEVGAAGGKNEAQQLAEALVVLPDLDELKANSVCIKYDMAECNF